MGRFIVDNKSVVTKLNAVTRQADDSLDQTFVGSCRVEDNDVATFRVGELME